MNTKEIKLQWVNGQIEKRFSKMEEHAKEIAKEIAALLIEEKEEQAKRKFADFCKLKALSLWEKVAFSDYVSLIKQKIELECPR